MIVGELLFVNIVCGCLRANECTHITFMPAFSDCIMTVKVADERENLLISPRLWAIPLLLACVSNHVKDTEFLVWAVEKFSELRSMYKWGGCDLRSARDRLDMAREVCAAAPKSGIPLAIGAPLADLYERMKDITFLLNAVQLDRKSEKDKLSKLEKTVKDLQAEVSALRRQVPDAMEDD